MVVAAGLTLVEPLADAEVNVPGVMATLVAPVVTQLSALLAPELMVAGFAAKEVIVGAEPPAGGWFDRPVVPQLASPAQANRMTIVAQKLTPEERSLREPSLFSRNGLGEPTLSHYFRYSIFDPALYRSHTAKWHFPQENATFDAVETATYGSKML